MTEADSENRVPAENVDRLDCGQQSCAARLQTWRNELTDNLAQYTRLEVRWSWLRLAVFLVCVAALVVFGFVAGRLFAAIGTLPAFLFFQWVASRHIAWKDKRTLTERLLTVVNESLHDVIGTRRPVRNWRRPSDTPETSMVLEPLIESGPTWSLTDQERDDLDLYASPVGIFGLLDRTSTDAGARRLRDMLDAPCLSAEHIEQRQQAVRWLAKHDFQRLDIMASALPLRNRSGQLDTLVKRLRQTVPNPYVTVSKCIRIWSIPSGLSVTFAVVQIFNGHFGWINVLALLIVLNILLSFFARRMLATLKSGVLSWVPLSSTLRAFEVHARHAHDNLPEETILKALKERFDRVVEYGEIPSLCDRLSWMNLGGLARALLNGVVFYDLHACEAILRRITPYQTELLDGLAALAELEALNSLACFSAEQTVVCYPSFTLDPGVAITEGRHPLIAQSNLTPNSVQLTGVKRTWVITGPNAAGKSTFLRMVGVNVLLAQIGSAVASREMTLAPVRLLTDVRIRDDLAKNESYFLSEVRRLRRMVVDAGGESLLLGLIDEPFRGTNSSERTASGIALVEHLLACGNLFILATHEERLAQTAAGSPVAENYHFQERLDTAGVTFDYRLRPGPAVTRTAIRILEQEQYPASLLERARELIQHGESSDHPSS